MTEKKGSPVEHAFNLAAILHAGQFKYDRNIPYICHIAGVTRLISLCVKDDDVIAAAILHDTIEKGGITKKGIQDKFGIKVAGLVDSMTEPDKGTWKSRKSETLKQLKKSKDNDLLMIACADKADNLYNLLLIRACTGKSWEKKAGRSHEDLLWYHQNALEIFRTKPVFRRKSASTILFSYENWFRELFGGEET